MPRRIGAGGPFLVSPYVDLTTPHGHYLWQLQRVQITRVERIVQPNHYSPLFFGRSSAVAAQIGQPWITWKQTPRIDDAAPVEWRANHDLHRYRTGFQTVGQPWQLLWKQPAIWFEPEVIRSPDHSALNRFRTTFQTVGQPWNTWQAYRQPTLELEQIPAQQFPLFAYRQFAPAAPVATQPFWIYQAYRQPDFEPEKIVSPQYALYPYRQFVPATAGAGQPWYLWPPIQITIEPEEKMYRENHDLSLYPFRPHDAFQPIPPVIGEDQHTPGRIYRHGWELTKEQAEQRAEQARRGHTVTVDAEHADVEEARQNAAKAAAEAYEANRKLAAVQSEIASLLAKLAEEGVKRTLAEQAELENALLLAEQRQILLATQQAVLREEMEIIDIAYVALVAWQQLYS